MRPAGIVGGMTRVFRVGALMALAASVITFAAADVTLTSTWKAPGEGPLNFAGKKVVALVVTNDENLRMSAEEALVPGSPGCTGHRISGTAPPPHRTSGARPRCWPPSMK